MITEHNRKYSVALFSFFLLIIFKNYVPINRRRFCESVQVLTSFTNNCMFCVDSDASDSRSGLIAYSLQLQPFPHRFSASRLGNAAPTSTSWCATECRPLITSTRAGSFASCAEKRKKNSSERGEFFCLTTEVWYRCPVIGRNDRCELLRMTTVLLTWLVPRASVSSLGRIVK